VPLSVPCTSSGFACDNFPISLSQRGTPTLWNVHRISLEKLPVLNTSQSDDVGWINTHVSLAFSDRERALREQQSSANPTQVDALIQVKDSLHCLFVQMSEPNPKRVFGFSAPNCGVYTLIFFNQILLDLASSTLIADVCILPLTVSFITSFTGTIARITDREQMVPVRTSAEEANAWKRLLPVFVERCRTWSHTPSCQYVKHGEVPLTVDLVQNPICACGEGRDLGSFSGVVQWKNLAPYVTRAAFSPLFAVPYIEGVAGGMKELGAEIRSGERSGAGKLSGCAQCGSTDEQKLLKCSRCRKISYCGQGCQREHWKKHKKDCQSE
jgi:hypothetical protein